MTSPEQVQNPTLDNKPSDKELNFRRLEERYQRELAAERAEKERLQKEMQQKQKVEDTSDEDDDEPYIDKKRFNKTLSSFEKKIEEKIEKKAEEKARLLLEQQKQQTWLKQNPDFYDVMQHAEKFAQHDEELAETILQMPEGFERQKLVYKTIKAMGIHKPKQDSEIQQKIDANRRGPYYQPSNIGTAPYSHSGDFSKTGQKSAYDKMQELKERLRLG